ncbi:hypothetical protein SFRURICE_000507 [Spodoptera frugiperda]|nr:hypothetical protein SFRURICE_000507 [Spodoptera frugiperda]
MNQIFTLVTPGSKPKPAARPPPSLSVARLASLRTGSQTLIINTRPSMVIRSLRHINQYYTPDTSYLFIYNHTNIVITTAYFFLKRTTHLLSIMVCAVAGQLSAVEREAGLIPARSSYLCHLQVVFLGLGVMCL